MFYFAATVAFHGCVRVYFPVIWSEGSLISAQRADHVQLADLVT